MPGTPVPHDLVTELEGTPYRWVRGLARGGMGEVHVVEHVELGTLGVLKILRRELQESGDLAARLRAEARLLKRMDHPNLVRVLDFGWTRGARAFLVSELLEGESLGDRLRREETLPEPVALEIARQTLAGLAHAHAHGLVHRDVKPDNLFLVGGSGDPIAVKLLDFGVAKLLTDEAKQAAGGQIAPTAAGLIVGTPYYMSPEQVLAEPVDARADVYSVGCTLYRMLVGQPPFPGRQIDVFEAHVVRKPEPPRAAAKQSVSVAASDAIVRALSKKPSDRFASANEMRAALLAVARTEPLPKIAHTERLVPPGGLAEGRSPPRREAVRDPLEEAPTLTREKRQSQAIPRVVTRAMEAPTQLPAPSRSVATEATTVVSKTRSGHQAESRWLRVALALAIAVIVILASWILLTSHGGR